MEQPSTAFRDIADVLETVETAETNGSLKKVTALRPRGKDVVAAGAVQVELGVRIPLLATETVPEQSTLTLQDAHLTEDGALHVDLLATVPPETQDGDTASQSTDLQTATTTRSDSTACAADATDSTTETTDEETPSQESPGEPPKPPAYRDPEQLAAVYDEYDTFAEMTDALDVDVTPQTVRRYMIKHGIHEPSAANGSQAAEPKDLEPDTTHPDTEQPAQGPGQSGSPAETGPPANAETAPSDVAADGHGGTREAATENNPESDPPLQEPPGESAAPDPDDTGDGNSVETANTEDSRPAVATSDVELPDHLTLADIKTTVQEAQTLYEAQQQLDLDREEACRLLQELNLLDLVHGRAATRDLVNRTIEDINHRLHAATTSDPEQA